MPSRGKLMKGVTRGLYSTPWNIKNPSPSSYMHMYHDQIHKKHPGYQIVTPTGSWPFWFKVPISLPFWSISMPRTLTNSSYRLNTTDFQLTQYHSQILHMKSYQKLSPTSNMVGVMVWFCPEYLHASILCHIHSATYWTRNSNIHPSCMTFIGFFLHFTHNKMTCY